MKNKLKKYTKTSLLASLVIVFCLLFTAPQSVFAGAPSPAPTSSSVEFKNPLAFNTVEGLLTNILSTVQMMIGVLAIVFIVIGGIIYITSAGDERRTSMAKTAIWAAIIGGSLAFAAPSFLKEIYSVLRVEDSKVPAKAQAALTLSEIVLNFLKLLMSFIGGLSVLMIVVGGVIYITSAGDERRSEMGKNTVKFAMMGIVIAMLSLVIIKVLAQVIVKS